MKLKNNKRRGLALFFTICTIGVVCLIVFAMMHFMRGEVHLSENYVDGTVALLLAESGVEESIFTIKSQMTSRDNVIYNLITTQDSGDIDVDLTRLSNGETKVEPLVKGGEVKAKITWQLNTATTQELADKGVPRDLAREGTLTINSMGTYNKTKKQVEVKKKIKAILLKGGLNSNSIGMIAPGHGFYLNKATRDSFKIDTFDFWDPWEFIVKGGKTYMKDGVVVDVPKWLMLTTPMKNELEHPWLDMGMGWTGWTGGANFTETNIEYSDDPVTREYYKWQGVLTYPWWEKSSSELYNSNTKKVEEYQEKEVNAYPASVYKAIANRVVDPEEDPTSGKYFKDVTFVEAFERNQVTYNKVLPLYGWGDWRNVSNKYNKYFGNPNKAHDTSHAVEINGVTYVKGDVFLEGWVKGQGLLVVEGNVYIGGDVLTLQDDQGKDSCLGVIALRSETDTSDDEPRTGKIIYEPHHDSDWSRFGLTTPFRNLSPRLEGSFHAQGGMELKTDSSMKKLCNMDIVGNLSVDRFDRRKMPNDVRITYYDWQSVLEKSSYDYTVDKTVTYSTVYDLAMTKDILSWREVPASL